MFSSIAIHLIKVTEMKQLKELVLATKSRFEMAVI